jgi:hypothetical protein
MEKKITTKKHGDALIRLMQVTKNATNKYLTIDNDDNISQKKKEAIGKQSLKAIRKQTERFDAIDKAYNTQSECW